MSLYDWIQEKVFHTYETWRLKSSIYNRTGFHIVAIEKQLRAMRDGVNMYVELYPPHAIQGCTCMKAMHGRQRGRVNLLLVMDGKTYGITDLSSDDAAVMMRSFVEHAVLPPADAYVDMHETGSAEKKEAFTAVAELLLGDDAQAFCRRVKPPKCTEESDAWNDAWYELAEELVSCGRAVMLDTKTAKEEFFAALYELTAGRTLALPAALSAEYGVPAWSKEINAQWTDTLLAGMDIGTDDYVLLVLPVEVFYRAKELAQTFLQRIARAEEL